MGSRPRALAALLLACLATAVSCSGIEEPDMTITGVDFVGVSGEGLTFRLIVDLRNPNAFGAEIGKLNYHVLLDDTEVASGQQDGTVAVPAESAVEVAVPFTVVWSGMDKGIRKLLDGGEHEWRLTGSVRLHKGALSREFRFSERGVFDAPRVGDTGLDLNF